MISFKAKLWKPDGVGVGTFATLPKSASAKLGAKARVPVRGTVNGFAFASSAFPDGEGSHILQVNATMRAGAQAEPGDTVAFAIEPATDEIEVVVPPALAKALKGAARKQWDDITPKARAEWLAWIEGAKKEETRAARVAKTVEMLAGGARRPKS